MQMPPMQNLPGSNVLGFIVHPHSGRILIIRRLDETSPGLDLRLALPGGQVEQSDLGTDPSSVQSRALRREIEEESALSPSLYNLQHLNHPEALLFEEIGKDKHLVLTILGFTNPTVDPPAVKPDHKETIEAKWMSKEEIERSIAAGEVVSLHVPRIKYFFKVLESLERVRGR